MGDKELTGSAAERFTELLEANERALVRLAASYARRDEQDDLLQEIAMALWRALPKFRGECSPRTFLFRIAHNRCLTWISRRRPTVSMDDVDAEPADPAGDAEHRVAADERRQRLLGAIRKLPAGYREVIVLSLEGFDYGEISEVVGISESNVGVRLNRARRKLKEMIEVDS